MNKRVKQKSFWMLHNLTIGWHLCCHKHSCHKSQCISKYLLLWGHLSFEKKFNNQFKNLIFEVKLPRKLIKAPRYLEVAIERHIGILRFLLKIYEKYLWTSLFLFGNVGDYKTVDLLKRNSFSGISQGFCLQIQLAKL